MIENTIDSILESTPQTPTTLNQNDSIEIRGMNFLGNEDRDFITMKYGIGDYIFINGNIHKIKLKDATTRTVVDDSGQIYTLLSEPNMDMFMMFRGIPWDIVKNQFIGENYTDYVPGYYLSFNAFADSQLTLYACSK